MIAMQSDMELRSELKRRLALRMLSLISIGILAFGLLALLLAILPNKAAPIGVGGIIFLAAASVGGAFGFLFAVPRVLAQDSAARDLPAAEIANGLPAETEGQSEDRLKKRLLRSNTNLERISDWLTTMLVGVGLSQLSHIDDALSRFRDFLAAYATPGSSCTSDCSSMLPAVGPMVLVFGFVMGFLGLYIYTRLVLVSLFNEIEGELDKGLRQRLQDPEAADAVVQAAQTLGSQETPGLKGLVSSRNPSVGESLAVMLNMLYQPGQWQEVIDLGTKMRGTPIEKRPEYWFYLAAAFGQKYSALKADGQADELASAREAALDCARRAVRMDPAFKLKLWNISTPGGLDDDLADLRDDPEFRALTGMTSRQRAEGPG